MSALATRKGQLWVISAPSGTGKTSLVRKLLATLGTALAGTVLVAGIADGNHSYALAMVVLGVAGLVGLAAALFLPRKLSPATALPPGAQSPSPP